MKVKIFEVKEVIESVGVEIECGICSPTFYNLYSDKFHLEGDSSVIVRKECDCEMRVDYCWKRNAEIKGWDYIENLPSLQQHIKEMWNDCLIKQNSSCGNHFHIKFCYPYIFTCKEFAEFFYNKYVAKFQQKKYKERLLNQYSMYSKFTDEHIEELLKGNFSRYKYINFRAWYDKKLKTIEFRIMPYARDANEYVSMMNFILDVCVEWQSIHQENTKECYSMLLSNGDNEYKEIIELPLEAL
jgi:hypothetical protein